MLYYILVPLAIIVGGFLVFAAMQPDDFRVERSATMSAPQKEVFAQVNDFHKWQEWSPWAKMDPEATSTFFGERTGFGAGFSWSGNKKIGEGRMTIIESRPYDLIRINLEFLKPFKATNTAEFTFKPQGAATAVSWSMSGKRNLMFKAMGLFVDCDKMIGPDFEKGLASMKNLVETEKAS